MKYLSTELSPRDSAVNPVRRCHRTYYWLHKVRKISGAAAACLHYCTLEPLRTVAPSYNKIGGVSGYYFGSIYPRTYRHSEAFYFSSGQNGLHNIRLESCLRYFFNESQEHDAYRDAEDLRRVCEKAAKSIGKGSLRHYLEDNGHLIKEWC